MHPLNYIPPNHLSATPQIERISLFKIPEPADRQKCLEQYQILAKTALKDGKPYILSLSAGVSGADLRAKGFNVAVKSTFACLGDMDYYDRECEAHAKLKSITGPMREESLTVWYENAL